jgi:hypothetical protein
LPLPPQDERKDNSMQSMGVTMWGGAALIAIWLGVLVLVITLANTLYKDGPPGPLRWFEVFYRIGSIIYGGGQVGVHPALVGWARCGRVGAGIRVGGVQVGRSAAGGRQRATRQQEKKGAVRPPGRPRAAPIAPHRTAQPAWLAALAALVR